MSGNFGFYYGYEALVFGYGGYDLREMDVW